MNTENHFVSLRESIRDIEDAIKKGIVRKQRTIGFHTSAAAADIYEIILHKNNLISSGFIVKHEWFASKNKMRDKLPFDFSGREEIIRLVSIIEMERNKFCYGKPREEREIQEVLKAFNQLRKKFIEGGWGNEL